MRSMKRYLPLNWLLIALIFFTGTFAPVFAESHANSSPNKSWFSAKVDKSLEFAAQTLDKALVKLFNRLDKSEVLKVNIHSHFYDAKIRRYFISISGEGVFKGKLPYRLKSSEYVISCEQEVAYDFYVSEIKYQATGFSFKYSGAIVFSLDRIAYELMRTVPHLAASGALSPAADFLTELLKKLDIGILSEAISGTLKSFSSVAFARMGADLLSAAGNNQKLSIVIKQAMADNSILSFLGLSILKCAAKSLVNVAGASLGSAVGSVVFPGAGTMIGAYLGSKIMSHLASTLVYQLSVKLPVIRDMNKLVSFHRILLKHPGDAVAAANYSRSLELIQRKIFREFNSDKFKLFHLVINRIDKYCHDDRIAFVPLLKGLQAKLLFLVTNEGDWLFAKYYHQLRMKVEEWQLQKLVPFSH